MNKLIALLIILDLFSALLLVNMRIESKKSFKQIDENMRMIKELKEDYKILQLNKTNLTNIEILNSKAIEMGFHVPSKEEIRVIQERYLDVNSE